MNKTAIVFFLLVLTVCASGFANLRRIIFVDDPHFLGAEAKRDLRIYANFSPNKAFAASVTLNDWGWSYGYGSSAEAGDAALRNCEERQVKCLLYAVGDDIVWDRERARAERARIVSSTAQSGSVWRYYGEDNQHAVEVSLPSDAPSIISDYMSERGILGGLRRLREQTPSRHTGIDIIAAVGTPVLAAADGLVIETGFDEVAGHFIRIQHQDDDGRQLQTEYIHLKLIDVSEGAKVRRGRRIGVVGATGSGTTLQRPHLHFATVGDNPHYYWHDGMGRVTCFDAGRFYSGSETAITYPLACK